MRKFNVGSTSEGLNECMLCIKKILKENVCIIWEAWMQEKWDKWRKNERFMSFWKIRNKSKNFLSIVNFASHVALSSLFLLLAAAAAAAVCCCCSFFYVLLLSFFVLVPPVLMIFYFLSYETLFLKLHSTFFFGRIAEKLNYEYKLWRYMGIWSGW